MPAWIPISRTPAWMAEVAVLVVLLVILGCVLVPAHRTSIWMDDEFSGSVTPISNRLSDGMVLYDEGSRFPIPRPVANRMWEPVSVVRRAAVVPFDTVLLLPNDPNVEE